MKAVRYHSYGDSGVLVYEDVNRPVAGPGQVVVKVAGTAFNPLDVAIRAGYVRQVFPRSCRLPRQARPPSTPPRPPGRWPPRPRRWSWPTPRRCHRQA